MNELGTVWIPQEAMRRSPDGSMRPVADYTSALRYGRLEVLLPPGPVMISTQPMLRAMREKMRDFSDQDYIVASGDPAAIAAAVMIAADRNHGRVKLLRWDRLEKQYHVLQFDLHERTHDVNLKAGVY